MKTYSWFIPMTPKQAVKLKAGLKNYFRFQLSLAVETVEYSKKNNTLTIYFSEGLTKPAELLTHVSCYINGFSEAIK